MESLSELVHEVRGVQGGVTEILRDTLGDYKQRESSRDKKDFRKDIIIFVLIAALIGCFLYAQWTMRVMTESHQAAIVQLAQDNDKRFKDFLSEYDFETVTEYTQEALTDGGGSASNSLDVTK